MPGCSTPRATTVRHLVVIGGADPSTTDELAEIIRDSCTVRTAYSTAEVLDRLDPEVDVVLVDSELEGGGVREAVAARDLPCQFAVFTPRPDGAPDEDLVSLAVPDSDVRERVERLATRASYRKTLEEYYALARASARLQDADGSETELAELERRLERLGRHLDEVATPLDAATLFRTVLGDSDDDEE